MKESAERTVKVGFSRDAKAVFDDVDITTAEMVRKGWTLRDSFIEEGLGNIHLLFDREVDTTAHD